VLTLALVVSVVLVGVREPVLELVVSVTLAYILYGVCRLGLSVKLTVIGVTGCPVTCEV